MKKGSQPKKTRLQTKNGSGRKTALEKNTGRPRYRRHDPTGQSVDSRIDELLLLVSKYIEMDFAPPVRMSQHQDNIDALGTGLTFLGEELNTRMTRLRNSEQQYINLIQNLPVALYVCDAKGLVLFYNKAALQLAASTPKIGKDHCFDIWQVVDQEMNPISVDDYPAMLAMKSEEPPSNVASFMRRSDGAVRNVIHHPSRNVDHQGMLTGVTHVMLDVTESKRMESELKEKERNLHNIFDHASKFIFSIDPRFRLISLNRNFELVPKSMLSESFVVGKNYLTCFREKYRPGIKSKLEQALRGVSLLIEEKYMAEGSVVWLRESYNPIYEGQEITGLAILINDVTDQKSAMERLIKSEELLSKTQAITHIGSWEWNLETNKIYWTDEAYRICGRDRATFEVTYENYLECVHPDDRPFMMEKRQLGVEEQSAINMNYRVVRPSGEVRYLSTQREAVTDVSGRIVGMRGIIRDVTDERKNADELLRLSLIARETLNSVIIFDSHGKVEWVNEAFTRMTEYTAEEVIGTSMESLLNDQLDPVAKAGVMERIRSQQSFVSEILKRTKTGRHLWVEAHGQPLFDDHGQFTHYFQIEEDITGRKLDHEKLVKSERNARSFANHLNSMLEEERSRIAREVHDEFGQQLTGLKMSLRALANRKPDAEKFGEVMENLISDVDVSLATLRKIATELHPGLIANMGLIPSIEWLAMEFEKKSSIPCRLAIRVQSDRFDKFFATGFYRICQEALTNILKHARASRVSIQIMEKPNELEMEISDNGVGIEAEKLHASFSLGLLGMRERANLLGATLTISSPGPSGTIIQLKAPIKRHEKDSDRG